MFGLKDFLLETSNAPRRCLIYLILLSCCIGFAVWDGGGCDLKADGPKICLSKKTTLRQRFDSDTICTTLAARDSVKVLGIDKSSFGQLWLVETQKGDIGWIEAGDLPHIRQIVTDGQDKGDTVTIVRTVWLGSHIHKYAYTNSKGEEKERSTDDFIPVLDGFADYQYNRDGRAGVCSNRKFETETLGKTLSEVKEKFGAPVLLRITPKGMEAQYSWKVFEPSTGKMLKPNVTFGTDSVAIAVSLSDPTSRGAWWLKTLPLASTIIDCPLTSLMTRGSRYDAIGDTMPSGIVKVLQICLVVIVLICYFFWMFFTPQLPVLLMGWLMKFPPVFYVLPDKWLKGLMLCVFGVSFYVWSVVMMAWGMFPIFSLLILILSWYGYELASSPLCLYPHIRCPKCRRMYTIEFEHKDFEYSEEKRGEDVVRGKLLGERTSSWKAWTEVTTTYKYGDGHTSSSSHRQDVHTQAQDYRTYEYISYDVLYRLDHYRKYYKCTKCGLVEETTSVITTELDRQEKGRYAHETAYGDEYRKRW